jgi:hypothetical protein
MEKGSRDPVWAEREAGGDDPFARAARAEWERPGETEAASDPTLTLAGPLAARSPDPLEETAERALTGACSFDDVLRAERRRGFVAGASIGAVAGAVLAGAIVAMVSGSGTLPAPEPQDAERVAAPRTPEPLAGLDLRDTPRAAAREAPVAAAPTPPSAPAPAPEPAPRASRAPRARAAAPASAPVPGVAAPAEGMPPPADRAVVAPPPTPSKEAAERPAAPVEAPSTPAVKPETPAAPEAAARRLDEEVAAALRARRHTLDGCVASAAPDGAEARPQRLRLELTLEPGGTVSGAQFDDAAVDASPLGACLAGVVESMSFPPFEGEPVRLALPLRLGAD